jgi:hypothetical protein
VGIVACATKLHGAWAGGMEALATCVDGSCVWPGITTINQITIGIKHIATLLDTKVANGTIGPGVKEMRMEVEKACRQQETLESSSFILTGRRTTIPWLQPSHSALRLRGIGYLLIQEEVIVGVRPWCEESVWVTQFAPIKECRYGWTSKCPQREAFERIKTRL